MHPLLVAGSIFSPYDWVTGVQLLTSRITGDLENRKHLDAGKFRVISTPVLRFCKQQLIPRQCTNRYNYFEGVL